MAKATVGTAIITTRAAGSADPWCTMGFVVVVLSAEIIDAATWLLTRTGLLPGFASGTLGLFVTHHLLQAVHDVRDRLVLGEEVLLNLLGLF